MIELQDVRKSYGRHQAVSGISFTALPGRIVGLLGPNGAGKSTVLRMVLGLDAPDEGKALVEGVPYRSLRRPLHVVGAQFDGGGAHRGRTARAHLLWVARSNRISPSRIPLVLDIVGLSSVAKKRVGSFSLGMVQRLGIATALLGDPRILVLDEPTNGLDPDGVRWLRRLLLDCARSGKTVLLSSHLMGEVEAIADEIVVIVAGRVVEAGPTAELVGEHANLEDAYFSWVHGGSRQVQRESTPGDGIATDLRYGEGRP